jgi:hypothetical protein
MRQPACCPRPCTEADALARGGAEEEVKPWCSVILLVLLPSVEPPTVRLHRPPVAGPQTCPGCMHVSSPLRFELAPSAIIDKDKTMGVWDRTREDDLQVCLLPQLANQTHVLPSSNSQISILPIRIELHFTKIVDFLKCI